MPPQEYNGYLIDNHAEEIEPGRYRWQAKVRINESFLVDEYWHTIEEGEADTDFHARKAALMAARRAVEDKFLSRRIFYHSIFEDKVDDGVRSIVDALEYAETHGAEAMLEILGRLEGGYSGIGLHGFVYLRQLLKGK